MKPVAAPETGALRHGLVQSVITGNFDCRNVQVRSFRNALYTSDCAVMIFG
jgi:hypothetical protein